MGPIAGGASSVGKRRPDEAGPKDDQRQKRGGHQDGVEDGEPQRAIPAPDVPGATGGGQLVLALTAAVGGGAEEILVRGALLFAVRGLVGTAPVAIVGTAVLAAFAGSAPGASLGVIAFSTLFGIAAGAAAARTSSVAGAVAAHALYSGLLILA